MSDRDREIDALFDRILDAPPEDREALLAGREDLRADVEALLSAHAAMGGGFLATPAGERLHKSRFQPGDRLGRYTICRLIAAGGAGTVYEAEQDQPHRTVALKVMHSGLGSERALRRFREEAEILARLDHPGIANVFEAGETEGVLFIAIELVAGAQNIVDRGGELDRRGRLELFAEVCDAVHHGHQQGIIHRDLKPANILVKAGRPKVIDFGIARLEESDEGEIAGTVAYMSPEQCEAGAHLDVRSDVYSLGVVLYELLRGRLPYDVSTTSITDAARVIRESPPAPLGIDRDLDAIVDTALAKERDERYASAAALASDVRRYLRREPIAARPAGRLHYAGLFVRRQPGLTAALAALVLVLAAGVLVSLRFAIRAERGRVEAEHETYRATVVAAAAALRVHDVEGARAQLALSPPHLRNWEWRHLVSRCDLSMRTLRWPTRIIYMGTTAAGCTRIAATSNGGVRVWDSATGQVLGEVARDRYLHTACALSPDGERLAVGDQVGNLTIHAAATGELLHSAEVEAQIWALAWSPDGTRLAVGDTKGVLTILSADSRPLGRMTGHEGTVMSLVWSPGGEAVFSGGSDRTVRVWDPAAGKETGRFLGHTGNVESLALSPDGGTLVSGSFDGTVVLRDLSGERPPRTLRGHEKGVKVVAFAPDGETFVSGALDHTLRLWSRTGESIGVLSGHTTVVRGVGYSPDGSRIVSFGRDETVKLWNAERPPLIPELRGMPYRVRQVVFSEGDEIIALGKGGLRVRWDRATGRELDRQGPTGIGVVLGRGKTVFLAHAARGASVRGFPRGSAVRELGTCEDFRPYSVAATPREDRVVVGEATGHVSVWPVDAPGPSLRWRAHQEIVTAVAVHPAGRLLATGHATDPVRLWRLADGKLAGELPGGDTEVRALAFSPDGLTLAVAQQTGPILLVDVETATVRATLLGHSLMCLSLAFSPDGTRLAGASADGTVRVWDPERGISLLVLRGHPVHALCVAWSPDGATLATGGGDHGVDACAVRLWGEAPTPD